MTQPKEPPAQRTVNQPVNRWRLVLCAAGIEPRRVLRVYPAGSYYHTCMLLRKYLNSDRIPHWKYVKPLSHRADSEEWQRAEAVRTHMHCPLIASPVWQLERAPAGDWPSDLFLVPRPKGMCWKCDRRVEGRAILCPECRVARRNAYSAWIQRYKRQRERLAGKKPRARTTLTTTPGRTERNG